MTQCRRALRATLVKRPTTRRLPCGQKVAQVPGAAPVASHEERLNLGTERVAADLNNVAVWIGQAADDHLDAIA